MKVIKVFVIFLILFLTPFMVGAQCPDSIVVNFDNDSCSGWTTDKLTAPSSTTWACGRPDKNVINGTPSNYNAWVNGDTTGIYDADEKSYVISPIYDFSCIQDPYLAIDIWWEVEDTWDGAAIQYSLDSGSTWKDIGDKGDSNCITRNWYNEDSVNRLETNNSDGWSGHDSSTTGSCSAEGNGSGQWVTAQHCLSGLGGEPDVQFRVIFGAGGICQCEGFAFDNFKILEPDRPSVTIDQSNPAICKGDSISLTTTTSTCGNSYLWNTGASSDTLRVSPAKDSTYSVTVTKTQCTKNRYDTASVTVTVDTQVTAGIMAPDSVCPGDSATLTGVGAPQYVWNTGATTSSIEVLPADSATYWVKGKNGLCKDTARDTIYHHAQPTATVSGVDSICSTDTTTLTASGGIDYTWSNGDTTSSVDVSPNNTTLYTVTVANAASCRDTAHYEVAADTAVTVQVSGVDSICPGDTAQLTAQGAPAYRWVTGATTKSIDASPNNDSAYWVVGNNGLCEDTAEHTLSLHPSPTAAVSGVDSICSTDTTTLTASGGVDYTWSNGGTTSSVDVSPNSTTQYTVTVANAASCQDTAHYEVAADTAVTVQVSGVDSICPGDTAQLSAQGAPAYRWVTGATKKSIDASPNNDSTYWVVGNNGLCQDSAFKTLGVSSSISATVSGPDSICKGHTATLVAGGGTAFEWSTGTTKDTLLITSMKDTAYWLRATSASCFDTIFDTLKVTPDISTNIMGVDSICEWDSTTLTANNGISYDWSTGATDSAITVSPANNTLYSVTVGNKFNCRDTADYLVRTDSAFSLQLAGVDSICAIDTVTLKASGAPFYHWSTGATADSIEVRPGKDSSYWVVGIHNLCRDTITDSIATAPGVSANIFSSEDSICEKDSVTLVGAGGPQYKWSTGEKDDSIEVAPDSTGVYSITISNTHCEAVATERVTVLNRKAVGISGVTEICPTDTTSLSAKGGGTYEWSTGDKNASITVHPDQSTTYRVTVNNRCGTFTDSITVDLYDLPKVSAGPDTVITEGQKLTLNAEGGVSYTWSPPLYLSCFACSDPVAQPDTSIRYTVFITDSHNCVQAKTVTLQVEDRIDKKLYIPNAFSPNGDGKNEVWRVRGTVDIQQIFVYDRWGNKLFEAEGNNRGWDGTSSNGKKVETGVYVYYIEIKGEDGKTIKKKGTVHLMR